MTQAAALSLCNDMLALQSFGPKSVSDMVVNLLKLVRCGTMGRPVVTLYRILYYLYTSNHQQNSPRNKEIERQSGSFG